MILPEICPRCEQATLPHDMHDERVCGDCCNGCAPSVALDPVLLELVLENLAGDVESANIVWQDPKLTRVVLGAREIARVVGRSGR